MNALSGYSLILTDMYAIPTIKIMKNVHHSPKHPSCCFAVSFLPAPSPE